MTKIKVIAFLKVNLMDEFHTFECKHCEILHSLNVSLPILYFRYIFTKPRSTYVHKLISYVSSRFTICCFFEVSQFRERLFYILIVTKNKIP